MQRSRKLAALAARLRPVLCKDGAVAPNFRAPAALDVERSANFHSSSQVSSPAAEQESASSGILFPREGPGVSYALNWALAAAGVTPSGDAHRNLKPKSDLINQKGAAKLASKSGSKVVFSGTSNLSKGQFNKLLKEVSAHVSDSTVYVHDGAVGSASQLDARVRSVSDSPAGSVAASAILAPTPTRNIAAHGFPITLYLASSLKSTYPDAIAVDVDTSSVIVSGAAVGDKGAIKDALAAVAASSLFHKGALLLPGRSVVAKGGSVLLVGPPSLLPATESLASTSLWSEPYVIWGSAGLARPFLTTADAPNLYANPTAIGILTADSSGAIPALSTLTGPQAAYYFLAGYVGDAFHPTFLPTTSPLKPLPLATLFAQLLGKTPVFLINTAAGGNVSKAVGAMLQKTLPSQKKGSQEAVTALNAQFDEYMAAKFPELPEGISR